MTREEALSLIGSLPSHVIEAIAVVCETADVQGDYSGRNDDGGSFWEDNSQESLSSLAREIRGLIERETFGQ